MAIFREYKSMHGATIKLRMDEEGEGDTTTMEVEVPDNPQDPNSRRTKVGVILSHETAWMMGRVLMQRK